MTEVLKPDQMRTVVATAMSAPSVHNTQPWLFRSGPDWLDVFADRSRQLPHQDPQGRELMLSCGAAVAHAELAVRGTGRACHVELVPDDVSGDGRGAASEDPVRVARLHVGDVEAMSVQEAALLEATDLRHSDRSAFSPEPVPDELAERLQDAAEGEGVHLHVERRPDAVLDIEVLAAGADRVARADAGLQDDVAQWVRQGNRPSEGVPPDALPDHGHARGSSLTLRDFDPEPASGSWADEEPPVAERPLLMVLVTDRDDRPSWLLAGVALGRLLLTATAAGLVANPQTQVLELVVPRLELRQRLGLSGWPQVLLRVGFPGPGPGSPRAGRRTVDDVLLGS